jgi:hypothetical protein
MHDFETTKGVMEERKGSHIVEKKLMIEKESIFILENLEPLISSSQWLLRNAVRTVQYIK